MPSSVELIEEGILFECLMPRTIAVRRNRRELTYRIDHAGVAAIPGDLIFRMWVHS